MFPIDPDLNLFAKEEGLVAEWNHRKLHPRVKKIAIVLAQYLYLRGYPCVITSIHRPDGIHAAWRAIDARCNTMDKHEAEQVRKDINRRFIYGNGSDGRPRDTVPPLNHGNSPHFHLQTKPSDD